MLQAPEKSERRILRVAWLESKSRVDGESGHQTSHLSGVSLLICCLRSCHRVGPVSGTGLLQKVRQPVTKNFRVTAH
jgi:hypothetical protein